MIRFGWSKPSFESPSDFFLKVRRSDRRQRDVPVAVDRRKALRRRNDIAVRDRAGR